MKRFLLFSWLLLGIVFPLRAEESLSLIQDAETEKFLLDLTRKIFKAVNLPEENARIILVNDDSINAFVAGGQTIFIHTGLITKADTPDDVFFVLAHETGHIVGGHVTRGIVEYKKAQMRTLISSLFGGLAAVAGGSSDIGVAMMLGGNSAAMNVFAAYRQTEESAADRTAVDILSQTGYSLKGFENLMKKIKAEERLNPYASESYLRTHPFTQERVAVLRRFLNQETEQPKADLNFYLVQAKLAGFLKDPKQVLTQFKKDTLPDKYARAIALYRSGKLKESFQYIDELIKEMPKNPFFYELKGQFLFETGKINQSVPYYEQAVQLFPADLLRLSLGVAYLKSTPPNQQQAINQLKTVVSHTSELPEAWRYLSIAYADNPIMARYALTEYYYGIQQIELAQKNATELLAEKKLPKQIQQRLLDIKELSGQK